MRYISFALTTDQVRARTKTVTRRVNWRFLKPGDLLQPIVKGQGLKKGEHPEKIGGPIRVVNVSRAPLNTITPQDVYREGFPELTREQFIRMFKNSHRGCRVATVVTRIEFGYLDEIAGAPGDSRLERVDDGAEAPAPARPLSEQQQQVRREGAPQS